MLSKADIASLASLLTSLDQAVAEVERVQAQKLELQNQCAALKAELSTLKDQVDLAYKERERLEKLYRAEADQFTKLIATAQTKALKDLRALTKDQ